MPKSFVAQLTISGVSNEDVQDSNIPSQNYRIIQKEKKRKSVHVPPIYMDGPILSYILQNKQLENSTFNFSKKKKKKKEKEKKAVHLLIKFLYHNILLFILRVHKYLFIHIFPLKVHFKVKQ